MKSEILTDKEIRKFDLQIKLTGVGLAGQEKIKKARILVIGAGGKGTAVLQHLVSAGVGYIGICDNYMIEESTLPKQHLYGDADLGKQKAITSKQRLQELTSLTTFDLHNICLSESNILSIINGYDILADATDNFPAHCLISDAAVEGGKPVVFGTSSPTAVSVSVFNYAGGPSLRSLYPSPASLSNDSSNTNSAALPLAYGIVGSLMANEILKIILGHEVILNGRVLRFCLSDYSSTVQQFRN